MLHQNRPLMTLKVQHNRHARDGAKAPCLKITDLANQAQQKLEMHDNLRANYSPDAPQHKFSPQADVGNALRRPSKPDVAVMHTTCTHDGLTTKTTGFKPRDCGQLSGYPCFTTVAVASMLSCCRLSLKQADQQHETLKHSRWHMIKKKEKHNAVQLDLHKPLSSNHSGPRHTQHNTHRDE